MSDKPAFPGSDAMAKMAEQMRHSAEDFAKLFSDMKLPGMPNADALVAAHKRNVEALTQANKLAMEGAQAVAKRHMDVVQQTMAELAETMRAVSHSGAPQEKMEKQGELLRRAYERAVEHTRELGELIQQTNSQAVTVLNQRFVEAMDEVKGLVAKAQTPG